MWLISRTSKKGVWLIGKDKPETKVGTRSKIAHKDKKDLRQMNGRDSLWRLDRMAKNR
jgi:hypothetical protein